MEYNDQFLKLFGSEYGSLTEELGSGTYGTVFLSETPDGKRKYAVKLEEDVELIRGTNPTTREIEAMKLLRGDPNVIQLLDYRVVEEPTAPNQTGALRIQRHHIKYPYSFIVMPMYETNLYFYMLDYGKRGFLAGKLIGMLLNGLASMKNKRVVNCDVKLGNVLVKHNDEGALMDLVYADFGMAKYIPPGNQSGVPIYSPPYCTFTGRPVELFGTAGAATLTTDVFSVACMLYECLIGFYLFTDGVRDIVRFHTRKDARMEKRKALFKRQLNTIMMNGDVFYDTWLRMLAIDPKQRPDADEVLLIFEGCPLFIGPMEMYVRPTTYDSKICEDLDSDYNEMWNNRTLSDVLLRFVLSGRENPAATLEVLNGMELSSDRKTYLMSQRHADRYYGIQDLTYDSDEL